MKKYMSMLLVACAVLLSFTVFPLRVSAYARYGVTCVRNNTGITINLSYRWGNRPWSSLSQYAGGVFIFPYTYDVGSTTSEPLEINLDVDSSPEREFYKSFSLVRFQSETATCNTAKTYELIIDSATREIRVISVN